MQTEVTLLNSAEPMQSEDPRIRPWIKWEENQAQWGSEFAGIKKRHLCFICWNTCSPDILFPSYVCHWGWELHPFSPVTKLVFSTDPLQFPSSLLPYLPNW